MTTSWTTRLVGCAAALLLAPAMLSVGAGLGFVGALRWLGEAPVDEPVAAESTPAFRISAEELDAMLEAPGAPAAPTPATTEAPPPPEEIAPTEPAPSGDPPAEEPPPVVAPEDRLREVTARIQGHTSVAEADLAGLSCDDLTWARAWIWASYGYPFASPDARAWFAAKSAYTRQPELTADMVEAGLLPEDRANRRLLNRALADAGCACPGDALQAPCPP